jgi:uncharacterized protein (DUF488 family)
MIDLFTIGYSSYDIKPFIKVLRKFHISAVVDVRSSPYSQFKSDFNKEHLQTALRKHNIEYVFLGDYCGARIDDRSCYKNGKVDFNIVATTEKFQDGIGRIKNGTKSYTLALMCAEKDPITCHRFVLVCRNLLDKNFNIIHILDNGKTEIHKDSELRLLKLHRLNHPEFFRTDLQRLEDAYNRQADKIAYEDTEQKSTGTLG